MIEPPPAEDALPLEPALDPPPEPWWRRLSWLAPWIGFGWLVSVLLVGLPMVARIAGEPLLGDAFETWWTESVVTAAALTYAAVLVPSLSTWLLRRDLALPIAMVASLAVLLTVGDGTGSLEALAVVAAQTALAWFVGLGLVSLAIAPGALVVSVLARSVLAFAVGHGLLGLVYLALGSFGRIDGPAIVLVSVALVVAATTVLLGHGRSGGLRLPACFSPTLLEVVLIAGAIALATWALTYGYAPETLSDSVRHHLPITREIWRVGSVPEFEWWTSFYPIHAQLVAVPAWAVGGMAGVSLSHGVVGLVAALGAAALALQLLGRLAAVVAFAAFVSLPLFLWEVGHAYVDMYPAMFVVAGAVAVLLWQRLGPLRILVLAGFLVGLAFASKTTAATGVGALGLAVVLVGRERFSLRSRIGAGLAVAGGGLLITPWLWRSYQITGTFPGLDLLTSTLLGTERQTSQDLADFGLGRGPLDLISIPWAATFQGEIFGQNGAGALGLLLLAAVPLVIFAPRTRGLAFALVLVLSGAIAWAFTAQYLRYSLPLLAVLAALAGVGIASLAAAFRRRGPRAMGTVVVLVAIVTIALAPLLSLPAKRNQVPFEFYRGEIDAEAILVEAIRGYEVQQVAGDLAGPSERVMWVGGLDHGIYTEAIVSALRPWQLGISDAEVLQTLAEHGIEYVIWELDGSSPGDWASRVVSPPFLRDHSELVMLADSTYLFHIGEGRGWEQGPQLLPSFEGVGPDEDWIPRGEVVPDEDGLVIPSGGNIKAVALVEAGATYIVRVRADCPDDGEMIVFILWKDGDNVTIGRDRQRIIPPGRGPSFILSQALDEARSAVVHVSPLGQACTVWSTTMRELLNAPTDGLAGGR